jgi:putative transposase
MFLEDYQKFTLQVPSQKLAMVGDSVKANPGITIATLLAENNNLRADDVYAMIASEQLYADLYAAPLIEHRRVQLYLDESIQCAQTYLKTRPTNQLINIALVAPDRLVPNTTLMWDGILWTLLNLGETTTTLLPEVGLPIQCQSDFFLNLLSDGTITIPKTESSTPSEVRQLMDAASPADLRESNRRFQKLQAFFQQPRKQIEDIAPRTLRDWAKRFRSAEVSYGCGYVGLLPRTAKRGNRTPKARYLFQHEQERQDFQGVLLTLLKQVPLNTDLSALMQHWFYFYERSIGCVGVLLRLARSSCGDSIT